MKKKNAFILLSLIFFLIASYIFVTLPPLSSREKGDERVERKEYSQNTEDSSDNENSFKTNDHGDRKSDDTINNRKEPDTDEEDIENSEMKGDLRMDQNSEMQHPDRITYQDGFYYEPLTDEIKTRIYGLSYKEDCTVPYEELRYVRVLYYNFDGQTDEGEIICNRKIAQDLVEIFYELYQNNYPIEKIRLVDEYQADDDLSCADNNSSSFNFRVIAGSKKLSKHALGMAIDINPFYNPYITYPNGVERISPAGSEPYADRSADLPHMIQKGDLCYNLFIAHGFTWGGEWRSVKDYQHFEKE